MKLVFINRNDIYDKVVLAVTGGKYAHCGIVIDHTLFQALPGQGVVSSPFNISDGWTCVNLPNLDERAALKFVAHELGCGYDWCGVARFVLPFLKPSKSRWFCSELAAAVVTAGGYKGLGKDWKFTPQGLYERVVYGS